jgi:hypothetical protein
VLLAEGRNVLNAGYEVLTVAFKKKTARGMGCTVSYPRRQTEHSSTNVIYAMLYLSYHSGFAF